MTDHDQKLAARSIAAIRFLSLDAIQKANSGHPGLPLGAAPMAYILWTRHLKFYPGSPEWADRDRFILSAGHGSSLLYSMLHLTGYSLSLEELKGFRQWGSLTPGHPENFLTPGVEATTGPLGQGIGIAVGMAIAEANLAEKYNRPGHKIVDHYTYALAGDGDLMEGLSYEACSLAGHLGLGKLIVLYDDNRISLAGSTGLCFTEDIEKRFEACGWEVISVGDGNDIEAIDRAIGEAKDESARPTLIRVRTVIGYGSPEKAGKYGAHGAPLGAEELARTKDFFGWPADEEFYIPDDVKKHMLEPAARGKIIHDGWMDDYCAYMSEHGELAEEFVRRFSGDLPPDWDIDLPNYDSKSEPIATRKASEAIMQRLGEKLPDLVGGCADLNPSTFAWLKGFGDFQNPEFVPDDAQGKVGGKWGYGGRNIHFGVREHAMGTIALGLALHGGFIPFTGTFFVFSDYMRPSIRLAAISKRRVVFIFSHDSIGVGEDGPTHQPVEQLMSLRAMPDIQIIHPADASETIQAWRAALNKHDAPTALVLSRQKLPILDREKCFSAEGLLKGGYILWQSGKKTPDVIIIGTGSEVHIALEAAERLAGEGLDVRVVSMPCWRLFDSQPEDYRKSILPDNVRARVAVEAGVKMGWERYVGLDGEIVGMESFGASAPGPQLYREFGITADAVYVAAKKVIERGK